MRFVAGVIVGLLILPVSVYLYFRFGSPPVAIADHSFPMERQITHIPLNARIDREAPKKAPIEANATTFLEGAQIYRANCMECHGQPGKPSRYEKAMAPNVPQLWEKAGDHVGVSDDPPGETYWKVRNGIRLTAMPSYSHMLDETQMWEVSLLLANADKPMPSEVTEELARPPLP